MILVRLLGGLGNQMFQYAVGRALADRCNAELVLDSLLLSGALPGITPRSYALGHFSVRCRQVSDDDVRRYGLNNKSLFTFMKTRLVGRHRGLRWVRYFGRRFNAAVLELPDNTCLMGNFQSEHYFAETSDRIRQDFSFREEPPTTEREREQVIAQHRNAVSVHIRRGDYATSPKVRRMHGLLSLSYYENAASLIAEAHKDAVFFIFSDDPEWVKANVRLPYAHQYMTDAGQRAPHEDMRLMLQCRHHITANSSFSWWAAWLSRHEGQIVLYPKNWFADTQDTGDIVPSAWIGVAG